MFVEEAGSLLANALQPLGHRAVVAAAQDVGHFGQVGDSAVEQDDDLLVPFVEHREEVSRHHPAFGLGVRALHRDGVDQLNEPDLDLRLLQYSFRSKSSRA